MPSRRPFHRGLDRAAVLAAALQVLDTEGREALTMRRVAKALDVEAASLYTHVRSKDDLIDGVLDLVLDQVPLPPAGPWRRAVIDGYTGYRRTLVSHPGVVGLMTERARMSPSQFRLLEHIIGLLEGAGMSTDEAVLTHVAAVAFTIGFVAQEVGRSSTIDAELLAGSEVMQRAVSALLQHSVDERFRFGLEAVLDGAHAPGGAA